jgi:putative phosphoesterase
VISDLHANIHALRAVWKKFEDVHVSQVVCLGDLVGYCATPDEVLRFLRDQNIQTTMGSSEARLAFDMNERSAREGIADQTIEWSKTRLSPDDLKWMRSLPMTGKMQTNHGRLRFMHGLPDDPDARVDMADSQKNLNALLEKLTCQILLTAGSHVPSVREVNQGFVVNPGSVGLSLNGEPGADCAVLDFTSPKLRVELYKVPYNYSAAAFDILTWDLPSVVADVIKNGSMRR